MPHLLDQFDRSVLEEAVRASGGRTSKVAERLGASRITVRKYRLKAPWFDSLMEEERAEFYSPDNKRARELAAKRRWREANPDKVRAINRKWAKNQAPASRAKWNHLNRVRRKDAGAVALSAEAVAYLTLIGQDPCAYCGGPAGESDHIVPLVLGGTNNWDNFTAACRSDNASKSGEMLLQYLLRRNVLGKVSQ